MRRLLLVFLLLLAATSLHARELHWQSIEVKARLDDRGTLHVVERQRFVFNGDWNGGERRFRIEEGQRFRFLGIRRLTASGTAVPLVSGDLAGVDQYKLDGDVLRWRSRLPSDPEFEHTVLTYDIEYEFSNILAGMRGAHPPRYVLNHDFAFADRPGVIQRFVLDLELDPSWRLVESTSEPLPTRITATNLMPRESLIVRRELTHVGVNAPAMAFEAASPFIRNLTILLVVGGIPLIFVLFWLGERARGRFVRPDENIDDAWLAEHIFSELPEVIGYMFDHESGAPEVAAILARLTQQGVIVSNVERRFFRRPRLRMTLHEKGYELLTQERQLVYLFFIDRNNPNETDTDRIRKYYKKAGVDPGGRIENALAAQAARNPAWTNDAPRAKKQQQFRTIGGAFALLLPGAFFGFSSLWLMVYMAVLGGLACWIGRVVATRSSDKMRHLHLRWLAASIPTLLVAWMLTSIARRELSHVKELPFLLAAVFLLTVYWFVMKGAVTKQSSEKMLLRARILAARRWFVRQLRKKDPSLRDEWTPYLLALGLGRNVDRWFSAFGGEVAIASSTFGSSFDSSASSFSSGDASVSSWSGGGGSFGGAGATGSWAAAAISLGSGSSAATSYSSGGSSDGGSSSSDSGSSGGSSSGGGGGGGW